ERKGGQGRAGRGPARRPRDPTVLPRDGGGGSDPLPRGQELPTPATVERVMAENLDQDRDAIGGPDPRPTADVPLLDVDNVTLTFGGVTALRNVSFDVRRGELFAVIGPNGAGKT